MLRRAGPPGLVGLVDEQLDRRAGRRLDREAGPADDLLLEFEGQSCAAAAVQDGRPVAGRGFRHGRRPARPGTRRGRGIRSIPRPGASIPGDSVSASFLTGHDRSRASSGMERGRSSAPSRIGADIQSGIRSNRCRRWACWAIRPAASPGANPGPAGSPASAQPCG